LIEKGSAFLEMILDEVGFEILKERPKMETGFRVKTQDQDIYIFL